MKEKKFISFNHKKTDTKWQKKWMKEKLFSPSEMMVVKKPFYNLWMYPYPSAEGLHAGHTFSSTGSDVYGRFMRMFGKDVFQPIGYDSFGMHSENYALQIGEHPKEMLSRTTKNFKRQLGELGHGYDWARTVTVSDIDYYRWTQWIFVQMFKSGLAYRKTSSVNWCPSCKTVIADEQVIAGECERCQTKVEIKDLKQWFFRITHYADKLLNNLSKIDWPKRIKTAQTNWIGKSKGATVDFKIAGTKKIIKSFTTRPDTLYGATFFVLAPEHPSLSDCTTKEKIEKVSKYVERAKSKTIEERNQEKGEKSGLFAGRYVVNPANGKKIPVYVSDYVVMDYGTGAIMGVPGHDQRDWDFAKSNSFPIIEVISGGDIKEKAYDGSGKIVNSSSWNGIKVPERIDKVIEDLEKKKIARKATTYHLRDWLISRQRYWGPPIPMVYCASCAKKKKSYLVKEGSLIHKSQVDWDHYGWYPDENLPVELPFLKDYQPKGKGRGPLDDHPEFYNTKCPGCGGKAKRETDVSDTFLDSSWYFLRYPSVLSKAKERSAFDPKITKKWLPVDLYFGGAEHSVLHLMYSRFVTQVLNDLGHIDFDEPFPHFYAHGLMIKDGAKMSKSRGNVVSPDLYIEKFGADTLRLYLMFMGPMDGYPDFRDTGIEGMRRFVDRLWTLFNRREDISLEAKDEEKVRIKMHQTIKKVTKDIEKFRYNTAISAIMEYVNLIKKVEKKKGKKTSTNIDEYLEVLVKLINPFAPHIAEEVWSEIFNRKTLIQTAEWPKHDSKLAKEEERIIVVQINGKLRASIKVKEAKSEDKDFVLGKAKKEVNILKWIKGKKIKKEVFVPSKLVNFVL